ncbi:lipopolysaccharide biosynthesis protein [Clostridium tagluense]|uniref:lipopolysaccharide biosynthesis protein n=1 Tax=Clostridium tagluense TaxID=360422 RepID=UPI001CF3C40B|nr:hypothetical protein [Clostridium tagluense]MCB2296784.1 hypothetical protein [Clostridium tagluense]
MRRKDSFLNIATGIGSQIILLILGLFSRKIFVNILGLELLGINGLLSNIISMLSLAELGIGGAIYYSLYKPLANDDYSQVRAIMQLYGRLYKYIALAVACIGVGLTPFLHMIIKANVTNYYLISVYMCFLIDAVLSYVLSYKKNIISANQKSYVINTIQTGFSIALSVAQIIIIITTHNFILYLVVKILFGFSSNLVFHIIANKMYPYLKDKSKVKLNNQAKAELVKNAKALFIVMISSYCIAGTDNILIAIFVNITAVGIYSNYILIIGIIKGLVGQIFNGIRASFGNYLLKESLDKAHNMFNILYFLNFWIMSFCCVCLIVLLNPFISIWLGKDSLFPFYLIIIMVANFYMRSTISAIEIVRDGAGMYSPYPFFKYWTLMEGILNLILGVTLAGPFKMGIMGILLATSITMQVGLFILPLSVYKYIFKRSSKTYFKKNFIYLICTVLVTGITLFCCSFVATRSGMLELLEKGIICLVVPNVIIKVLFNKTTEFQYIQDMIKGFMGKRLLLKKK